MLTALPDEHVEAALGTARDQFFLGNPYGVYGVIVAPRRSGGKDAEECTLRLMVEYKTSQPERPVPAAIEYELDARCFGVRPDVVAGGIAPRTSFGAAVAFTGLHAGCTIRIDQPMRRFGAVCALLDARQAGRPTHALTAGHLFALGGLGTEVRCAASSAAAPGVIGRLVANALDEQRGDLAILELTAHGVALAQSSRAPVRTQPIATLSTATLAACYRPTTHDWSHTTWVHPTTGWYWLHDQMRGWLQFENPAYSAGAIVAPADSGSSLCGAPEGELLGSCIGTTDTWSLFQPLEPLRDWITQRLGGDLRLWMSV